jgi:hypothetical protein
VRPHILYKSGYKYQLAADYAADIEVYPPGDLDMDWVTLSTSGALRIKAGYAWDGPSGPTIDTKNFMRGSLVHDALYQLMREGYLDAAIYREPADRTLYRLCREDGMLAPRAWFVYYAVRWGAAQAARKENPIRRAPDQEDMP